MGQGGKDTRGGRRRGPGGGQTAYGGSLSRSTTVSKSPGMKTLFKGGKLDTNIKNERFSKGMNEKSETFGNTSGGVGVRTGGRQENGYYTTQRGIGLINKER